MIRKALTFPALVLSAFGVNAAFAQANGPDAPAAIVISYRAQPEARAKFRGIMKTEGIAQLNYWQKQGIFASYKALYTVYAGAGNSLADMFLILRFHHFTDIAAWQKIETTMPGGLPASAQAIAFAQTSDTADILKEETNGPSTPDSQYVIVDMTF